MDRDVCYCASFYSSVKCTNMVIKFGERCRLCKVMDPCGRSIKQGQLPDDMLYLSSQSRSDEERDEQSGTSPDTARRPSWPFDGLSMPLSRKSTQDGFGSKAARVNPRP
ncbi:hypothetical protein N658DRAFT_495514 [Parathielavia hyrcaniae]|uniref:Uncharacterized protein n=1 Tax=Parathielavia hyrcaniae TaxID=113614 RepID=A0AAN6T1Z2_9PEZI|nr:hypothetical protein N658DRAFT_495514 [Parathielavia hyrcaniae]